MGTRFHFNRVRVVWIVHLQRSKHHTAKKASWFASLIPFYRKYWITWVHNYCDDMCHEEFHWGECHLYLTAWCSCSKALSSDQFNFLLCHPRLFRLQLYCFNLHGTVDHIISQIHIIINVTSPMISIRKRQQKLIKLCSCCGTFAFSTQTKSL